LDDDDDDDEDDEDDESWWDVWIRDRGREWGAAMSDGVFASRTRGRGHRGGDVGGDVAVVGKVFESREISVGFGRDVF
jgi:hypothetical protein